MHRYSVPRSSPIKDPSHVVHDQPRIEFPMKDGKGSPIIKQAATAPPLHHGAALRSGALMRDVDAHRAEENVPRRYYWHQSEKVKYCHYLDDRGMHWYGFYHGPTFYWTRYHAGRWWWYDQNFHRWAHWYAGFWWWQAPTGLEYVFVDNNYYPYEEGVVTTKNPEVQAPPIETLAADAPTQPPSAMSPDGKRSVRITGPQDEAYLYDESAEPPAMLKYLGHGVNKARFSVGAAGKAPRILLDFKDGSFALFDADGNPLDAPPTIPLEEEPPGPPPDTLPPEPPPQEQ
jgi:hypothetical protein